MSESYLYIVSGILLSFLVVELSLPYFNNLLNTSLSTGSFFQPGILVIFFTLILFVGIGVGGYPAFFLSSFKPINTIRDILKPGSRKFFVGKILVIGQFVISISLIICAIVIYQQIGFMKKKDLGFEKEQKMIVNLKGGAALGDNSESVLSEFLSNPSILGATVSSNIPGRPGIMNDSNFIRHEGDDLGNKFRFNYYLVDFNFLSEYKFNLIAGRPFQVEKISDSSNALIVNEAGAKDLGFISPEEALGKRIVWQQSSYEIIGVTKDFHYSGLMSQIEPFFFAIFPRYNYISFSVGTKYLSNTIKFLDSRWKQIFPGIPFEYFFLDEDINRLYISEERTARIIGTFSILSLFIACLGIFGLITYTVEQKTKEIGIRKVLGSSITHIVILLSKTLLKWILLAVIISWPIAWYLANKWLQTFFYRIEIGFEIFILAGGTVFIISLLSMGFKSIRAAQANPVDSLKHE